MRVPVLRALSWTFALLASALFAVPLASLFLHADVTLGLKALIAAVVVLAAAWPPAAVLAIAVLLPLALALEYFLGPAPPATAITEAILLAFAAGAALRLTVPAGDADRLSRPALILGALIASSAAVTLIGEQALNPSRHVAADLWRHVTTRYLFTIGPWGELHQAVRWLSALAVAVYVERALRRAPAMAPQVVRMALAGGAAAASFAALRVASLLLERRIDPDRWVILRYIVTELRISALHPDPNAAGSYFVLFLVPAVLIALRRRSLWLALGVIPLVAVAFVVAQSRAAMLAAGVVLGIMAIAAMFRARRFVLAAGVIIVVPMLGVMANTVMRSSHASIERASQIRHELTLLTLEMARDHPAFGAGIGRYREASRAYVSDKYPGLQRFAPTGQNAHNNFLQILGDLGPFALAAFLWLVLPVVRRWPWEPASASDATVYASALAAGLAAFLVSALFGHPLLVPQVAAAFFLALGLTSALRPAPAAAGRAGRIVVWVALAAIAVTLPWRIQAVRTEARDTDGVGEIAGTIDEVPYRRVETESTWRLASDVAVITLPLRWEEPALPDCRVTVRLDGRVADEVRPDAHAWMPLRFPLPPVRSRAAVRELQLHVSDPRCKLIAGPLDVVD